MQHTHAVNFDNVRYCYGNVCAVDSISFCIRNNTLAALIGPNGGGKSTVLKMLAGLIKADEGSVKRMGTVAYVPQTISFDISFPITVRELVLMGTLRRRMRPFLRFSAADRQTAAAAIVRAGLTGYEGRSISNLSGGQLGRALIARALASDADIIVLDEPDASLDIDAARDLYSVLGTLKKDRTIIVASHRIDAVLGIADSAVYINRTAKVYAQPHQLEDDLKGGVSL